MANNNYLNRYTDLPSLIHILNTKSLTLLSPQTWDDKNDSFLMAEYKERRGAKTLLALCFSQARERYHHWRVFSHGSHGVCIELDKVCFLHQFTIDPRIKHGAVRYMSYKQVKAAGALDIETLPFLKRSAYKDEAEYRVIYANLERVQLTRDYLINLEWIRRITLSPWMPSAMLDSVEKTLRAIPGCQDLNISHSTLINSERWKEQVVSSLPAVSE